MAAIATCPDCGQQVTIPERVDESVLVRCPLCSGEYPLGKVGLNRVEAPPSLVPVAEPQPKKEPLLRLWDRVTALPADDPPADSPATEEAPGEVPREAPGQAPGEVPGEVATEAEPEAFDFAGNEPEAVDEPEGVVVVGPGRRRSQGGRRMLRELLGVVLGGVVGVCAAYYVLNLFGGARFDFARIYLPGIRHTVEHRPDWWPEWARFEGRFELPDVRL